VSVISGGTSLIFDTTPADKAKTMPKKAKRDKAEITKPKAEKLKTDATDTAEAEVGPESEVSHDRRSGQGLRLWAQ
jgi:hypothetical protein